MTPESEEKGQQLQGPNDLGKSITISTEPKVQNLNSLPLPALAEIEEAFQYFLKRHPRRIYLTAVFQMRVNSKIKERELLLAHKYVTTFARRVLDVFGRDDPDVLVQDETKSRVKRKTPRCPLIFRFLLEMFKLEAGQKEAAKAKAKATNPESVGDENVFVKRGKLLSEILLRHFNAHHLLPEDDFFSSRLRTGVYELCGVILLNWCSHFLPNTPGGTSAAPLSIEQMHNLFIQWDARYKVAEETKVPCGRHKGKQLKLVGKRDLRWLLTRIPDHEESERTLSAVELLLELRLPKHPNERDEALLAEHPWRTNPKREMVVRQRRIDSRVPDVRSDRVLLQELSKTELERLRDELLELRDFRTQFDQIRTDVETVLNDTPPSYPTIGRGALPKDDPERAELKRDYAAALRWLDDPFPENRSATLPEDFTAEVLAELEREAQGRLVKAAYALDVPHLHPLSYTRTMAPQFYDPVKKKMRDAVYSTFALLCDAETDAYVLAVATRGAKIPKELKKLRKQQVAEANANGTPKQMSNNGKLRFFNFRYAEFLPPARNQIMRFSLEYAADYQDNRLLAPVLAQLRAMAPLLLTDEPSRGSDDQTSEDGNIIVEGEAPQSEECATNDEDNDPTSTEDAEGEGATTESTEKEKRYLRPRAPLGTLRVVCRWDKNEQPRFFAHIPVPMAVPGISSLPEKVLGIHEHPRGYSYAIISLVGKLHMVGDLLINPDVLPRDDDSAYNANYSYEVVSAILKLIQNDGQPEMCESVYIGFQDTMFGRSAGLSRAQNRWRFSRPTRKIIDILNYKAPLQRLLQPRLTSQVSGQRDCCQCGVKLAEGDSAIRRVLYVVCPQCQAYQSYQKDADFIQQCSNTLCGCTWRAHEALVEQEFVCPACKKPPMIARYNTAIVVAQRTLQQLVLHYQRVLALKARTTNSGASTAGRVA